VTPNRQRDKASKKSDDFYVQLIILVRDIFYVQVEAYWALTTSSTFPQSTPKIANMDFEMV
jgi:hypothetical protein